jgi:hypothetical protein
MAADGAISHETLRAYRLASGPQSGDGWHLEWADSAFGFGRFQYVVKDRVSPPWAGLDDMLIARGLLAPAEVVSQPEVSQQPREEYAF